MCTASPAVPVHSQSQAPVHSSKELPWVHQHDINLDFFFFFCLWFWFSSGATSLQGCSTREDVLHKGEIQLRRWDHLRIYHPAAESLLELSAGGCRMCQGRFRSSFLWNSCPPGEGTVKYWDRSAVPIPGGVQPSAQAGWGWGTGWTQSWRYFPA